MKRRNNLYQKIISVANLQLADKIARKGKGGQYGIIVHDRNREANILALHERLKNKTYRTSPYKTFPVHDPKERLVYQLPYYPDRIVHHAIMIYLKKIFVDSFTADTYSCIEGRGIHKMSSALTDALQDVPGTQYCLKLDIKKFYPNVNHEILKKLIRRKIKDPDLLWLLDEIIDSAPGVPIGNYLSQYFANYYLSPLDHIIKEKLKVKKYFRYADDMVALASNKPYLHQLLHDIRIYLRQELKLEVKENYQVFLVSSRGINVAGYVHFHTHKKVRPSIKKRCAKKIAKGRNTASIAGYNGWFKHADCKHLTKKLLAA